MLFNFDVSKLASQLCPPILRSSVVLAIIRAICVPLNYLSAWLNTFRSKTSDKVKTTSNVVVLEGVLNEEFHFLENEIYISTMEDLGEIYIYKQSEIPSRPNYLNTLQEGKTLFMLMQGELPPTASFTVHIPKSIATSLNPEEDNYQGVNLLKISEIVNQYKPVGKKYNIEIYE